METPYIIRVCAQKGGVGKTTIAVNLAVSLRMMGYNTLLIDADTTNPSIGFHLGLENANIGTWHFAHGRASIKDAVHIHAPTGLHVMPGVISAKAFLQSSAMSKRTFKLLKKSDYQFIVIDTQPGFLPYDAATPSDNQLIITNPTMPSCASAIRLAEIFNKNGVRHSLIVNKVTGKKYDLSISEILEGYNGENKGNLPDDENVPISIAEHIPCVVLNRKAKFSKAIMQVAEKYATGLEPRTKAKRKRILDRIMSLLFFSR